MTDGKLNCAVCGGKNLHYANCPLAGVDEVYAVSAIALNFPEDVMAAAHGVTINSDWEDQRQLTLQIALAILAERKRCAEVARNLHVPVDDYSRDHLTPDDYADAILGATK